MKQKLPLIIIGILLTLCTESRTAHAEDYGTIAFKLDGQVWSDDNAKGFQNDYLELTLKSGQYGRSPAESIVIGITDKNNRIATGSYSLGEGTSLFFTDANKTHYASKDGSGNIVVTKYLLAEGEWVGARRLFGLQGDDWVEGTFSGKVVDDSGKSHVITEGTFSVPVWVYIGVRSR